MSFNHRLIKHESDNSIGIYEVYYNEDGSIRARHGEAIIVGNDLEDLKGELSNLQSAFNKDILNMNVFGEIKESK